MSADASALAIAGGFFIGTYPIFVKTPAVLAADVHPAVFQLYKSFWVAVSGLLFVVVNGFAPWVAHDGKPFYSFTWWAVLSACAWVPAGTCLVAAVPRVGVGAGVLLFDGSTTLLSFLAFTLVFHEPLKPHYTSDGATYYLAPYYLLAALVGMAGLVLLPKWLTERLQLGKIYSTTAGSIRVSYSSSRAEPLLPTAANRMTSGSTVPAPAGSGSTATGMTTTSPTALLGCTLALSAGLLSSVQYGVVTVGKHSMPTTSPSNTEALNPLGSWTLTFGLSATLINTLGVLTLRHAFEADALPGEFDLKLRQIGLPASAAGLCYSLSVICTTMSVERGGNAVVLAQRNAMSLVTSGLWGLLWYKEVRGWPAGVWCLCALLTMSSVVMLGLEKGA